MVQQIVQSLISKKEAISLIRKIIPIKSCGGEKREDYWLELHIAWEKAIYEMTVEDMKAHVKDPYLLWDDKVLEIARYTLPAYLYRTTGKDDIIKLYHAIENYTDGKMEKVRKCL